MKSTDEQYWTREAISARQYAILEKYGYGKPKPATKPKPTAKQKAQEVWSAQPLEGVLKANTQSNQLALERAKAELEEAEAQRERERYRQLAERVNTQAIEAGYAQRQWEALAERRWDPTGNWGSPNYQSRWDD